MSDVLDLQEKMAWLEKQVTDLDVVVRGLGDELSRVRAELRELRSAEAQRQGPPEGDEPDELGLLYEKPPHY